MNRHYPEGPKLPFPLYSQELPKWSSIREVECPSKHMVLLVAGDFRGVPAQRIVEDAQWLIDKGLLYVLCWGPECEKAHDAFDMGNILWEEQRGEQRHVMSTWHDSEPFAECLWFCLHNAYPDDRYWEDCSTVILNIAGAATVREMGFLDNLKALDEVCGL